jgi:hypothetical protein
MSDATTMMLFGKREAAFIVDVRVKDVRTLLPRTDGEGAEALRWFSEAQLRGAAERCGTEAGFNARVAIIRSSSRVVRVVPATGVRTVTREEER